MTDLLKVLDMSEDRQWDWLYDNHRELVNYKYIIDKQKHLADLAFRLRDEVCGQSVHYLQRFDFEMIMRKVCDEIGGSDETKGREFLIWLLCEAKPIHWIIAALIAKEKK